MTDMREEYEKKFPVPPAAFWVELAGQYWPKYEDNRCKVISDQYQYGWEAWQAARTVGEVEATPNWGNRNTDSHAGWVNELLTLSDHHGDMPGFARRAMRTIAAGLEKTYRSHPAPVAKVPEGYALLPRELTAENGAKYLMMGEFFESIERSCEYCEEGEDCELCNGAREHIEKIPVEWSTIKDIWRRAVDHFTATPQPVGDGEALKKAREVATTLQTAVCGVIQDCTSDPIDLDADRFKQLNNAAHEYEKHHDLIMGIAQPPEGER